MDTRYGVPYVEEGGTTLHPRRHRVDLRGEKRNLGGFISGVRFVGGFRDYKHDEIEASGDIATTFTNKVTEGNLYLNHRAFGALTGTFGVRGEHRDYNTVGEEALAPPTIQNSISGFLYEELTYRHSRSSSAGASTIPPSIPTAPPRSGRTSPSATSRTSRLRSACSATCATT